MTYDPKVLNEGSQYPVPHHLLPAQLVNRSSPSNGPLALDAKPRSLKDVAPYNMPDLTIPSYLKLARRLGKAGTAKKKGKIWKRFTTYMFLNL